MSGESKTADKKNNVASHKGKEHVVSHVPSDLPAYFYIGKGKKAHNTPTCAAVIRAFHDPKNPSELKEITKSDYVNSEKCLTCESENSK